MKYIRCYVSRRGWRNPRSEMEKSVKSRIVSYVHMQSKGLDSELGEIGHTKSE